jgi:hypothetical protein
VSRAWRSHATRIQESSRVTRWLECSSRLLCGRCRKSQPSALAHDPIKGRWMVMSLGGCQGSRPYRQARDGSNVPCVYAPVAARGGGVKYGWWRGSWSESLGADGVASASPESRKA